VSHTRRAVVLGIAAALTVPGGTAAQLASGVKRIGVYTGRPVRDGVVESLGERGWAEGRGLIVDWHGEEGSEARIREHLARAPVDVLIVGAPLRIRAAMQATTTVPIVAIDLEADPVASGFVKTLARPGGNVTGIWMDQPEIAGKQIQFLRELMPSLDRLGVVWDDRIGQAQFSELQAIGRATGITLLSAVVHHTAKLDDAVKRLVAQRPQAIVVLTAPVVFLGLRRIAELAAQSRLPSISPFSPYPASGGLMAYGPDFPALWRQLGGYVDRVLRGMPPGQLPVERPSKFTLIVNLKTAKSIGVVLPESLVYLADEVIQ
jgi:putative ABC transport system substrate-binding protein